MRCQDLIKTKVRRILCPIHVFDVTNQQQYMARNSRRSIALLMGAWPLTTTCSKENISYRTVLPLGSARCDFILVASTWFCFPLIYYIVQCDARYRYPIYWTSLLAAGGAFAQIFRRSPETAGEVSPRK